MTDYTILLSTPPLPALSSLIMEGVGGCGPFPCPGIVPPRRAMGRSVDRTITDPLCRPGCSAWWVSELNPGTLAKPHNWAPALGELIYSTSLCACMALDVGFLLVTDEDHGLLPSKSPPSVISALIKTGPLPSL